MDEQATSDGYGLGRIVEWRPTTAAKWSTPGQVFVPVRAVGGLVLDNGGDVIAECFTPDLALRIANLLNQDAAAVR